MPWSPTVLVALVAMIAPVEAASTTSWSHQFGTTGFDAAASVATASNGDVVVVGTVADALPGQTRVGGDDVVITRYDQRGRPRWTRQFGTAGDDRAGAITVASNGDAYVVGETTGALGTPFGIVDAFVARFDRNGNRVWLTQFGTPVEDSATDVQVTSRGVIYVAGTTTGAMAPGAAADPNGDAFLARFDRNGSELWVRQFATPEAESDTVVATTSAGDAYLAGRTYGSLADFVPGDIATPDVNRAFLARYSRNGALQWVRVVGAPGDVDVHGLATTSNSDVYLAGTVSGDLPGASTADLNPDHENAYVARFNRSGRRLWIRQIAVPGSEAGAAGLTISRSGRIYLVGQTDGVAAGATTFGDADGFVMRLDRSGRTRSVRQFGSPDRDTPAGVAISPNGTVYVAGSTFGQYSSSGEPSVGLDDIFVARLGSF
jgi:hypothetical protein